MKIDLSGKVAVVSGSTRGIGFATARGLGASGAAVVVNGRTQAAVDQAVANLNHLVAAARVRGIAADVGTAEGCDCLVTAVPECDILINNLGIYGSADFFKIPDSDWARYFDINVMSGIRLSRAYMPGMMHRGWGRIVFISSESALNIPPDMIHYGLTKTAQLSVSRGLAKLAAGSGVTVNAVLPGPTRETIDDSGVAFVQSMRPSSIIRRPATTDEVANMVIYTVSPEASATTGAALRVDGGVVETIT
jgi:NAD(P)-dependent dehydrogenase (short-subunit alcohol dehydrogenase family)